MGVRKTPNRLSSALLHDEKEAISLMDLLHITCNYFPDHWDFLQMFL